jgi:hypothetical protein
MYVHITMYAYLFLPGGDHSRFGFWNKNSLLLPALPCEKRFGLRDFIAFIEFAKPR